jgi:hypothetical protein
MLLVVGIAVLYIFGFVYEWNYSVWWYDILLHFLGGVWIAIVAHRFLIEPMGRIGRIGPILIIALVALVGVGWEFYEFTIDEIFFEDRALWRAQEGNTDTMTDLMMDILGGAVVAGYFSYRSYMSDRSNKSYAKNS